jgi:hypothetical protein
MERAKVPASTDVRTHVAGRGTSPGSDFSPNDYNGPVREVDHLVSSAPDQQAREIATPARAHNDHSRVALTGQANDLSRPYPYSVCPTSP